MASETSICNQALGWIGADRILSIDDGTPNANLCKDNYVSIRDAVLEEGRWTFATKRFTLTPLLDAPEYGYGKAFLISSTVLNIIEARDDSFRANGASNLDWRREEDKILADADVIYMKCIVRVTDTTKFSALFTQAFATRMAAELSPTFTASNTKTRQLWTLYSDKIAIALALDGSQGRSDRLRARYLTRQVR